MGAIWILSLLGRGRDWLDHSEFRNGICIVFHFSSDHSTSYTLEELEFLAPGS